MDSQFNEWQQAFKDATPQVDKQALLAQVNRSRRAEKLKGWADLILGLAVSALCVFMLISHATDFATRAVFTILSPIPISVGVWAFIMRKKQWQMNTLDVESLLAYKEQTLLVKLRYWKVNLLGVGGLFIAVLAVLLLRVALGMTWQIWLIQLGVFSIVLMTVIIRYQQVKRTVKERLNEIEHLRNGQ